MKRQFQAISVLCALAIGLHASPSAAQSDHRLLASIPPSLGDLTLDPNDSASYVVFQQAVPGTNPASRFLSAYVDSASGILAVNASTNNLLNQNRSRAVASIEQLMDMDSVPTVINATLILNGSGSGGPIEIDARIRVGTCIVSINRDVGTEFAGFEVNTNGCTDSSFVTWETSGGDGALHITSTWAQLPLLGEVHMDALVIGDFGGLVGDIPNGSFSNSGQLSIDTSGGAVAFYSDSFLTTVPETSTAAGLVPALGTIALLARQRAKQKSGSREGGAFCHGGDAVRRSRRTVEGSTL